MKTEIVVAHLSDLHHPSIKADRWEQLKTYLINVQPDLILVTGDLTDHPWPWRQLQVRRKLENLVQACQKDRAVTATPVKLSVIPGNHDSAFWGNFGASILRLLCFNRVFSKYYERFYEISLGENKAAYFFCFNSNPFVARWAKGKVSPSQLKSFQQKIDALRQKNRHGFDHAYKIALLHHHPMPIPHDEKLERYLFLKNAGEFINAMAQNNVNLILHGHKHKSRISYISLGTSSTARHIGIVACGTTMKRHEENTCYIIKIFDNMRAEVTKVFAAADANDFTEDSDVYSIPRWDTYIQDRYEAIKNQLGYEIGNVAYKVIVDEDGDGHTEVQLNNLKITSKTRFQEVAPFEQQVSAGTIGCFKWQASGATNSKLHVEEQSDRVIKLRLDLSKEDSETHSFDLDYWAFNSWAIDTEQWNRKYRHDTARPRHSERFFFGIVRPIQQFRAEVQLPKNCKVSGTPELIVQAFVRDGAGEESLSKQIIGIEKYLNVSLTFLPERNVILLALDKPLYGYNYTIRWYVSPPPQTKANDDYINETTTLIKALWKRKCLSEFGLPLRTVEKMIREKFKVSETEVIDVTLAIPVLEAEPSAALEFIASNVEPHPLLGKCLDIGDGTQGRAFKRGRIGYYNAGSVNNHDPKSNVYMAVGGYGHRILYAVPIVHPMDKLQIIGILSIGSLARMSDLRPKGEKDEDKKEDKGKKADYMMSTANDYFLLSLEGRCNIKLSRPSNKSLDIRY